MERLSGVGRIGLTTYLMQTVIGVMLFFGLGLGLLGEIGSAAAAGLGVLIFLVQIVFARWWLTRFSLGPMEWIWRSLTNFAVHPNSFAESARTDRSAI
jgi:uncharacterized protein